MRQRQGIDLEHAHRRAQARDLTTAAPAEDRTHRIDVLFNRGNFYVATPGCRQVCLVENANALSHPSIDWPFGMRARLGLLSLMTNAALQRADYLVFPSADTARVVGTRRRVQALEAMAMGCPCVVSDLNGADPEWSFFSPFREICGNAVEYCDPRDPVSIANAMARALTPARRSALVAAGYQRAQEYPWSRTAVLMDEVLEDVETSDANDRRARAVRP